jgi:hypothetical protein
MQPSPTPLEIILGDIRRAIDAKLYYPALVVALTIPDLCAGLMMATSEFVKKPHYLAFLDKYAPESELGLNGEDCFMLRGGIIHRGDATGHPHFKVATVIFTLPNDGPVKVAIHGPKITVAGVETRGLDLVMFCDAMEAAARRWLADNRNDAVVAKNMPMLLSYRPDGWSVAMGGVFMLGEGTPVIASGIRS